jgi:hypothetical protein
MLATVSPPGLALQATIHAERTLKASCVHRGSDDQSTRVLTAAAALLTPEDTYESRTTYIYFVREVDGPVKIGYAQEPRVRLGTLQVGNPRELYMLSWIEAPREFERVLHQHLAEHRLGGEWYAPVWQVFDAIDEAEAIFGPTHRHDCRPCARESRLLDAGREPDSHVEVERHTCGTWPFRDQIERGVS